jgi:predicted ArsR family transcriptional regulator
MDVPVRPGDTLSQPTRARLFALLGELRRPVATDELSEHLGLHPNGVRLHLERMLSAGLIERRRERIARGRPRDTWVISPEAQPAGDPPAAYTNLARWLVRALAGNGARVRDVESTGQEIGRHLSSELAPDSKPGDEQQWFDALAALGFAPERERLDQDRLVYHLRNCPYQEAVAECQTLVCGLHRGITRGLLEGIDPETRMVGFEARDPGPAGCMIRLRGPLAREARA